MPPHNKEQPWYKRKNYRIVLWAAAGLLVVLVLLDLLERSSTYLSRGYVNLNLDDPVQLRGVFFSGEPWTVLCKDKNSTSSYINPLLTAVDRIGQIASNVGVNGPKADGWGRFHVGVVDCSTMLPGPSGQNIYERFKLTPPWKGEKIPVIFHVANGERPVAVPDYLVYETINPSSQNSKLPPGMNPALQAAQRLYDYIRTRVQPRIGVITDTNQLKSACIRRPRCGLVLSHGELVGEHKATLATLVDKFRNIRFHVVDQEKYQCSLASKLGPLRNADGTEIKGSSQEPRFVFFRKPGVGGPENESGEETPKSPSKSKARPPVTLARAHKHTFDLDGVTKFISDALVAPVEPEEPESATTGTQTTSTPPASTDGNESKSKSSGITVVGLKKYPTVKRKKDSEQQKTKPAEKPRDREKEREERKRSEAQSDRDRAKQKHKDSRKERIREGAPKPRTDGPQRDPVVSAVDEDEQEPVETKSDGAGDVEEVIDLDDDSSGKEENHSEL